MRKILFSIGVLGIVSCGEKSSPPPPVAEVFQISSFSYVSNGSTSVGNTELFLPSLKPVFTVLFNKPVNRTSATQGISIVDGAGTPVSLSFSYQRGDSLMLVQPAVNLSGLSRYQLKITTTVKSVSGLNLHNPTAKDLVTNMDSTRKFPPLTDDQLLDKVQQTTFKYFWDFGHPVSGLARERNTSGDLVTSGGSGFGAMAIVTGVDRGFITRAQGLARMQTMVSFLKNTAVKVKGAFPHWLNGATGAIIPFSTNDNGADLVETSYLMMGLLTARQYFNGSDVAETTLRADINTLYNNVEWDWFRNSNQQVLYWHYSADKGWAMNLQIRGWNECLITYVLAASSTTHSIPASVYTTGWARNGASGFVNGNTYYGYTLPLGTAYGGPLFFAHYSFLGINPNGLTDVYTNYNTQNRNHTLINYEYCRLNAEDGNGYSDSLWGLTASDVPNGYTASSPNNDVGVIAPTAALSSMPYTPAQSMAALKFFYYVLGDKIWKEYGFVDAFSLGKLWYASSFLAIDQGPIIIMLENYRTGLLWNLFTSCPEVKTGMRNLGFSAPYL